MKDVFQKGEIIKIEEEFYIIQNYDGVIGYWNCLNLKTEGHASFPLNYIKEKAISTRRFYRELNRLEMVEI